MSLFARSAFRAAQPLKQTQPIRRYATSPPNNGSAVMIYAAGAAVVGGGYYAYNYLYDQPPRPMPPRPQPAGSQGNNADTPSAPSDNSAAPPSSAEQENVAPGNTAFKGGDQGFISLLLKEVEQLSHNTKRFKFALPNPDDTSGLPITSSLLTRYKGPQDSKPTIRPYTPVSAEKEKGNLEFVIKKYENGPMSTHLHEMEPGQRLDMKGPIPKYPWAPNKHPSIALIAGGTGITPMYQLANAIFSNPNDKTNVTLIFGNLTEEDILLKREFEHLENTYPNRFRAFYLLDHPPSGWAQGKGHITKELLQQVLPFEPKDKDGKIFVCGPPGLYKAISGAKKSPQDQGELTGYLKELGYDKGQVYKF